MSNIRLSGCHNARSKARCIKETNSQPDTEDSQYHPPIHEKCPAEVMQLIFELCAPLDHIIRIPSIRRLHLYSGHTLIAISHVCSAWRTLVLDIAKLWSHVQLDLCYPSDVKYIEAAQTLFSRATHHNGGCIDLSLTLENDRIPYSPALDEHETISLCKLITSFPFQKLDLNLTDVKQMQQVLRLPNKVWSNVDELRLTSFAIRRNVSPVLFYPEIDLSKLRLLKTSGFWERLHPDVVLPWHQLRHLSLSVAIPLSVFLNGLRQATLLEYCMSPISASTTISWHQRAGIITLPSLHYLNLSFIDGEDARPFLDLLVMPNLTALEVDSTGSLVNCDEATFVEMAHRSGGMKRLQTLEIGTDLDTVLLRRNIPSLKYVSNLNV
ncbi:hypothetical protein AX17_003239 [Amanita inopinata Kibby_2008]|nr:hypothetical protein AX17_003239 [Amanita inopinata Kibby_2008]